MKTVELVKIEHNIKIGDQCPYIEPNVVEDTIFTSNGIPIGFYLKNISGKLLQYVEIANAELLSNRVPKEEMSRGPNSKFYLD